MEDKKTLINRGQPLEQYLLEKRNEIIFALSAQDYTEAQIGRIFRLARVSVHRILKDKPSGYRPKWVKRT